VNQIGMGKDMWFVSFDHITEILEVRFSKYLIDWTWLNYFVTRSFTLPNYSTWQLSV